jgi:thiol:disulfide interchange protein DsbD
MSPFAFLTRRRVMGLLLACSLIGVMAAAPVRGEDRKAAGVEDLITFKWSLSPEDPFSKQNMSGPGPFEVRRGETFFLTLTGTPKPGFHTYPVTKRTDTQSGGNSELVFQRSDSFVPLSPVEESEPELVDEGSAGGLNYEYNKPFTWTQEILVKPEAKPGQDTLRLTIRLQVCDEHRCTRGTINLEVPVTITKAEPAELAPGVQERVQKANQPKAPDAPPEDTSFLGKVKQFFSFLPEPLLFIVVAAAAGAVSLVTPCVFPMIPITVSYFLKQSEAGKESVLKTASIYSGTIIIVLTVGGLLVMTFLQQLSQHWATNLLLGGLFVFFALSLLGMYEITLPSWLVNLTSSKQNQGGAVGTVFMALTFTIVSFTCVAPFYGGFALSAASAQSVGAWLKLFFAALAYSVTFALPFFVLALFPSLMKMLPKSGGWMNTIKVVMGFLELAAALGFFRTAEVVITAQQPLLLTFDVVLGLYVALSLTCGVYLLGLFRLPHDYDAPQMLSVPRLLFALAFIGLGLYLTPGLFKQANGRPQRPSGVVFEWIESFLLADNARPMYANLKEGLEQAKKQNKRVFIDFTGVTCKNCRINENTVFSQPEVHDLLSQYVLVQLYTDTVPAYMKNPTSAADNAQFEKDQFKTEQLPLYVIVEPSGDSFTTLQVYDEGKINDVEGFKSILKKYATPK